MKSFKKIILAVIVLVLVLAIGYWANYAIKNGPVGTGFTAKLLCSSVFLSDRKPEDIWPNELAMPKSFFLKATVNYEEKSVTASLPGLVKMKRTAVFREGLGCTLLIDSTVEEFRKNAVKGIEPLPPAPPDLEWPYGDRDPAASPMPEVNAQKLKKVLDDAFSEPDPDKPRRTRAIVIVYNGRIIAERYAPGFTKDTRQLGWSMTKSVNSALIGILVHQGKLDIHKPAPVPEWKQPGDPRGAITTDQLLRMSSGLEFLEEYENNPASDAGKMFFTAPDMAAYAANKPLEVEPDKRWEYSSGTSNMLSRVVRHTIGNNQTDYLTFPQRELFGKLGMRSAVIEPDESGTFVGAGYMYATPRDWARFGLLYLNDGIWNGERILPEGWIEYTRTPTIAGEAYGAQWWLNKGGKETWMPKLPSGLYSAWGHDGQYVTILPSKKLVVVRMGLTPWHLHGWDHEEFILGILDAIKG